VGFEEVGDFGFGGIGGIGAVNSVFVDGEGEVSAKGAGFGIFGLVAPMRSRFFWMAFSPSRTRIRMGPEIMKETRSWKKGRFLCTA